MPYGILKRADVADVVTLATGPGPVTLFPVLKVEPDTTIAEFDAAASRRRRLRHRPGNEPRRRSRPWCTGSRASPANGAMIVGVCSRRQGRRVDRTARRQARHHALVFHQQAARQASRRSTTSRTAGWWPTRRRDHDGHYSLDADVAHADRGNRGPRQGARPSPATSASPTGTRGTTVMRSSSHAPFALTAIAKHAGVLEPRAAWHRAQARRR